MMSQQRKPSGNDRSLHLIYDYVYKSISNPHIQNLVAIQKTDAKTIKLNAKSIEIGVRLNAQPRVHVKAVS